ncbi:MAG: xylose isomerase, partial [Spirochaetaceae bacterium]|nr:xylose isomerase [Spirochaetaceae bacterium]
MADIFATIPKIKFEGPLSDNPLAFKRYDPDKKVGGRTMKEQLRFSMAFWHSMTGSGRDPFGDATAERPWDSV